MSTPTPIEIVRERLRKLVRDNELIQCESLDELNNALASVLRDAERLAKLEDAHKKEELIYVMVPDPHDDDLWAPHDGTLAELADRLKGTQCSTTLQSYRSGLAFT